MREQRRPGNDEKFKTGTARFTGYYSPTAVDASADPSDVYRYPVYAAPEGLTYFENPKSEFGQGCGVDAVTKLPIHWCIDNKDGTFSALPTREQIAQGALDAESRKIAYFKSLYDVSSFMLEGAGSVNLRQKDGSVESVVLNFAGTNGRPNNMIGDVLKCENKKINGSLATYSPVIPRRPIGTPSITIPRQSFTNGGSATKAWIILPSRPTPRSLQIQLQFPPAPSPCSTCPRRVRVKPSPQ